MNNFSGSRVWFQEFKKRYSYLKFKGEVASADKVEEFLPQIIQIIEENGYVPDRQLFFGIDI